MARSRIVKDAPPQEPPAAAPPPAEEESTRVDSPPAPPKRKGRAAAAVPVTEDQQAGKGSLVATDALAAAVEGKPGPTPPGPKPSAKALEAAAELAAELAREEQQGPPPLPFAETPSVAAQLSSLVGRVIDEGLELDVTAEYDELEVALKLEDALTPQAVRAAVNESERNAKRAHRLFVVAKYQFERFKLEAEVALGAMRDAATAKLGRLKALGQHPKQVTDSDVRDLAAVMYSDEWRAISDELAKAEQTLAHIQRFADLWQRRSWSLSSLNNN